MLAGQLVETSVTRGFGQSLMFSKIVGVRNFVRESVNKKKP